MIANTEDVARAIFSPKMIVNGEIQPEAFRLRYTIGEDYLSVMRLSVPSWLEDIKKIPQRKNRKLHGFAEMNVGEIRGIHLKDVSYDVKEVSSENMPSHAGIYIEVGGFPLTAERISDEIMPEIEQDFLLLAIQRELVDIAQKGLHVV